MWIGAGMAHAQVSETELVAPGNIVGNNLGNAVDMDADVIVAGARATLVSGNKIPNSVNQQTQEPEPPGTDNNVFYTGAAAVFRNGLQGWELDQYIPAPFGGDPQLEKGLEQTGSPATNYRFGQTVAVSGDRILVGAPGTYMVRFNKATDCPTIAVGDKRCGIKKFPNVGQVLAYEYDAAKPAGERWVYTQLLAPPGDFQVNEAQPVPGAPRGTQCRPPAAPYPPVEGPYDPDCNYFYPGYTRSQFFGTAVAIGENYAAVSSPGNLDFAQGRRGYTAYPLRLFWYGSDSSNECASLGDPFALPPEAPLPLGTPCWHVVQDSAGDPWKIDEVQALSGFGSSLAISSDAMFLVVGAPVACLGTVIPGFRYDCDGVESAGAVYIYEHNGLPGILGGFGPDPVATLLSPDPGIADLFGISVDIDGDRIAVGANLKSCTPYEPTIPPFAVFSDRSVVCGSGDGILGAGAVYVFSRDGLGDWAVEGKLQIPSANLYLGTSVALRGDNLFAGAPGYGRVHFYEGAVFQFRFENGSWDYVRTLTTPFGVEQENFGTAVAVTDSTLAVGDPTATPGQTPLVGSREGRVFAYTLPLAAGASKANAAGASNIYTLKANEKIKISGGCPRGRNRITAELDLASEGNWRVSTSTGYVYGGETQVVGANGTKMLLHLDDDGFREYEATLVDWSKQLCPTPVTEVSTFNSSKFTVKRNKARTGIKVKLKTVATGTTPLGTKKAKHSLVGKGRAR